MNGNSAVYTAIVLALDAWPLILVGYLLFSWIVARMARRRGLGGWPLAWIPMMNLWVMGSLCDQYRYVVCGKKSRNRVWLPVLAVALELLMVFGVLGFQGKTGFTPALWATLLDVTVAFFLVRLYLCLYRLYLSSVPRRAVAWLVWSVCVPILPVVFLLLCKEKEQGMPVRRVMFRKPMEYHPATPPAGVIGKTATPEEKEETLTSEEDRPGEDGAVPEGAVPAPETADSVTETQEAFREREEVEQDG